MLRLPRERRAHTHIHVPLRILLLYNLLAFRQGEDGLEGGEEARMTRSESLVREEEGVGGVLRPVRVLWARGESKRGNHSEGG